MATEGILDDDLSEIKQFTKGELNKVRQQRNVVVKLVNQAAEARTLFMFILAETSLSYPINYGINYLMGDPLPIFSYSYVFMFLVAVFCFIRYKENTKLALLVGLLAYLGMVIYILVTGILDSSFILSTRVICIIGILYNLRAVSLLPKEIQKMEDLGVPKYWVESAKDLQEIPPTNSLLEKK